jgi:hypothetical protein
MVHLGQSRRQSQRRGVAIVEISAASLVLIMAIMLLAQLLYLVARQERASEARELAGRTAANELEAMLAEDWEELQIDEGIDVSPPEEVLRILRSATLKRQVLAGHDASSKQLRVELAWHDASGEPVSPVTLVAWKHRPAHKPPRRETP